LLDERREPGALHLQLVHDAISLFFRSAFARNVAEDRDRHAHRAPPIENRRRLHREPSVAAAAEAQPQAYDALGDDAAARGERSGQLGLRQNGSAVVEYLDAPQKITGGCGEGLCGTLITTHAGASVVDEQKLTRGV